MPSFKFLSPVNDTFAAIDFEGNLVHGSLSGIRPSRAYNWLHQPELIRPNDNITNMEWIGGIDIKGINGTIICARSTPDDSPNITEVVAVRPSTIPNGEDNFNNCFISLNNLYS